MTSELVFSDFNFDLQVDHREEGCAVPSDCRGSTAAAASRCGTKVSSFKTENYCRTLAGLVCQGFDGGSPTS